MISIRMLKLRGETVYRPLNVIFKKCLNTDKFSSEWKKRNAFPIYKKDNKQNVKNYVVISLLSMCGKIFERLICNVMYDFLTKNNLLFLNQSRFQRLLTRYGMMVLFLNSVKWYKWRYPKHFTRISSRQKTKSSFEWSVFILG